METNCLSMYKRYIGRVGYIKISDNKSILIMATKHLIKEVNNFNVYAVYLCKLTVSWLFYGLCHIYFRCFYRPNGPSV